MLLIPKYQRQHEHYRCHQDRRELEELACTRIPFHSYMLRLMHIENIAELYVPEVIGAFVRYFVVFLFLEGLYLRPDSGATNMRRDRPARFVRRYMQRSFHRSIVPTFVHSFVCSSSSITSQHFYIHNNLQGYPDIIHHAHSRTHTATYHANRE